MKPRRPLPILAIALFATAGFAAGDADAIIAKARAFLGGDKVLDAVKSLQFSGAILEGGEKRGEITITLQKPFQQRIERTIGGEREITALDEFDAWTRRESVKSPDDWRLTLIQAEDIKRLQANNVENLNFFKGAERRGGTAELVGSANIDGIDCAKIVFTHSPGIDFTRYFDRKTGRLVMTETEKGGEIREHGEQVVAGIRFPTSLESRFSDRTVTITFDKIVVNETYPDSLFAFPTVLPNP